jgi:hypothetical protein
MRDWADHRLAAITVILRENVVREARSWLSGYSRVVGLAVELAYQL